MSWWLENIFLRLLLAFVLGILLATFTPFHLFVVEACILAALFIFLVWRVRDYKWLIRLRMWRGVALQLAVLLSGMLLTEASNDKLHPLHYESIANATHYMVQVNEPPSEKQKVIRVRANVLQAVVNNAQRPAFGAVYLYMRKSPRSRALQYGDVLLIKNTLQETQSDPNPHAIDYKFLLENKHIYRNGFLSDNGWTKLPQRIANPLYDFAYRAHAWVVRVLENNFTDKDERAVAEALLVGYRDEMDFQLENAYAATGVVHLLAVSGLRIAIVLLMLRWLLKPVPDKILKPRARRIVLLVCIWFFALLTGLSGSAVRACMMVTVLTFGPASRQYTLPLNILFGAAFLLLMWEPRLLFDIGFELSLTAMIGILLFQPTVLRHWHANNRMLDALIRLSVLSLTAQLGTLPLTLYYFHQFPMHFLVANLLLVPIATYTIYGLILLLVLNAWTWASVLLSQLLGTVLHWMNAYVYLIRDMPFSVYYIHHYSIVTGLAVATILLLLYAAVEHKRVVYLNAALMLVVVVISISVYQTWTDGRTKTIVAFQHSSKPVVSIRDGYDAVLVRSRFANFSTGAFDRYLEQYYQREGVLHVKQVYYEDSVPMLKPFAWVNAQRNVFQTTVAAVRVGNRAWRLQPNGNAAFGDEHFYYSNPVIVNF